MSPAPTLVVLSLFLPAASIGPVSTPDTPAVPVSSAWQGVLTERVRSAEYAFQPVDGEANVWSAPNRSQELRSRVSASGLEVFSRTAGADGVAAPWKLELRTASFGRLGEVCELAAAPASIAVCDNRIELEHGPIREWLENRLGGIEQGWTIDAARRRGTDLHRDRDRW